MDRVKSFGLVLVGVMLGLGIQHLLAQEIFTIDESGSVRLKISPVSSGGKMELKDGGMYVKRETFSTLEMESAADGGYSNITGLRAKGSLSALQPVVDNDVLLQIGGRGYYTGGSSGYSGSRSRILFVASEPWTDAEQGSRIVFMTTANDGTATGEKMRISDSGNVGIGTGGEPGASSILDVASTTKGVVIPRMTKAQRDAIASPVNGMMIYQTDNTPGLRVRNGTNWMKFTEATD